MWCAWRISCEHTHFLCTKRFSIFYVRFSSLLPSYVRFSSLLVDHQQHVTLSCHNSAYTFSASWKEQVSLHPSSPLSTGEPLRACWPAASLSGTETVEQQTARPSSRQWTQLQKSLVALSPPSWIFSLHDAPAKPIVSWRTPPTPPTVSSSSYPQVDGTGASEPPPTPPTLPHHRKITFFVQFIVYYTQVSGPVPTTCSNTLSSIHTRHFTHYCVYITPQKTQYYMYAYMLTH